MCVPIARGLPLLAFSPAFNLWDSGEMVQGQKLHCRIYDIISGWKHGCDLNTYDILAAHQNPWYVLSFWRHLELPDTLISHLRFWLYVTSLIGNIILPPCPYPKILWVLAWPPGANLGSSVRCSKKMKGTKSYFLSFMHDFGVYKP